MNAHQEVPVITADTGESGGPASIIRKAKEQAAQTAADMKYDAPPPARLEGFCSMTQQQESIATSFFLASAIVLGISVLLHK